MTKATFVSVDRSDLGPLFEILLAGNDVLDSRLIICGEPEEFADEFRFSDLNCVPVRPPSLPAGGDNKTASLRIARLVEFLIDEFIAHAPDIIVMVGDRYELLSILAAAVPSGLPLAHVSGGEITEGAFDEQIRHAVTKASHLHFVANEQFAGRIQRMGEETWRVHVTGDPGLDRIRRAEVATVSDLNRVLGVCPDPDTIIVAYHPVTNSPDDTWREWAAIEAALGREKKVIVTASNLDPQGTRLRISQRAWCEQGTGRHYFRNLGQKNFLGILSSGAIILGNSSAGIWEAPSLASPAINLGLRQRGRLRGPNVIDVELPDAKLIQKAIHNARSSSFRESLKPRVNPYGDGFAAEKIVSALAELPPRKKLLAKSFVDR